jgi:hypothetical protein
MARKRKRRKEKSTPAETLEQVTQRLVREHGSLQVGEWLRRGELKGRDGDALIRFLLACAAKGWYPV